MIKVGKDLSVRIHGDLYSYFLKMMTTPNNQIKVLEYKFPLKEIIEWHTHFQWNACFPFKWRITKHGKFLTSMGIINTMEVEVEVLVAQSTTRPGCSRPCSSLHGIFQARILEWVFILFSRRSSQARNWTHVCIASRFFLIWATREV